jgi:hypothetical protein
MIQEYGVNSVTIFSKHVLMICPALLLFLYPQTAIKFGRNVGLCDTVLWGSLASCIDDVRLNFGDFNDAFRGIGQHAFLSLPSLHIFAIDNFIHEAGKIFLFVYINIGYTSRLVLLVCSMLWHIAITSPPRYYWEHYLQSPILIVLCVKVINIISFQNIYAYMNVY